MSLEKGDLIPHSLLEPVTGVDIKMSERVVFHLCEISQNMGRFLYRSDRD
jgi:hypothetical protein